MKRYRVSEIFHSVQGEGHYTGVPSLFLRFWGCNFRCRGFGSEVMPTEQVQTLEEFPVGETGCDTEYAWNPIYRHLSNKLTAEEISDILMALTPNFQHTSSGQWTHLVLTGGEPMLCQNGLSDVLKTLAQRNNLPRFLTVETNGTQMPHHSLEETILHKYQTDEREWFWSTSPKLSLSGESWSKAIQPKVLAAYQNLSDAGQLKYVSDGSEKNWAEIAKATQVFRQAGVNWDVLVMPVGSTVARLSEIQTRVCKGALERGYRFAPRLQAWLFGNTPGT